MKKLCSVLLAAAMIAGLLSAAASAYTGEVTEMIYIHPSNSYVETSTCTRSDGSEHTVYIFPAGTVFEPDLEAVVNLVVMAWTLESLNNNTASYYAPDYLASGYGSPSFVPEPGVVYLLEETNTMDWAQDMYIMVKSGPPASAPEPACRPGGTPPGGSSWR